MTEAVPAVTVQKWASLASHLVKLTRRDKLEWRETSDEETFVTVVGSTVVSIGRSRRIGPEGSTPIIEIIISDKSGKVIDRFDDEDIFEYGVNYTDLADLLLEINRKLSGADEVLDSLLKDLQQQEEIPF